MSGMATHARKDWTAAQAALAIACATLGLAIGILGFLDIYLSVTHLLHPIWGDWSWTVIVLGEGSFAGCYLGWLLLVLRDRLPVRIRVFLVAYLSAFAAGSLVLNLYAGWGSVPGIASHAIVVGAFFGYLLFVKVLIHRLSADPAARALEEELADARQHAIDLVRDRCGMFWRLTAPRLLRRQITSGRFPHAVLSAVRVKAETRAETVHQDITRRASEAMAQTAPQRAPEAPAGDATQAPPQGATGRGHEAPAQDRPRKRPKPRPRAMSDDDLKPYVRDALAANPEAPLKDIQKATGTGPDRARRLRTEVQAERPSLSVAR